MENEKHFDFSGLTVHLIEERDPFVFRQINLLRRWLQVYTPFNFAEKKNLMRCLRSFNPHLVHVHFGYNAVKLMPILKRLNIPMIVSFHGIDASNRIYGQAKYFKRLPRLLDYASSIIIVSSHMLKTLRITEDQRRKVRILPCSVDHDYFNAGIAKKGGTDMINIVHSGRLVAKKGVPDLITVFADLAANFKHIRLHILGTGDEYMYSVQLAQNLQIGDMVTFYGSQPRDQVRALLEIADIFVLNSRVADNGDMEGTPVSLLEAMSMQCAVVSTYHAGIPDVVSDGHNGLLVHERSNDELYAALHTLINNPDLRTQLGANARNTVVHHFNKDIVTAQLLEAYNRVLDR